MARVHREVRPLAVEGRSEREGAPGPDQLAVHGSPASYRADHNLGTRGPAGSRARGPLAVLSSPRRTPVRLVVRHESPVGRAPARRGPRSGGRGRSSDHLVARDGGELRRHLRAILHDPGVAAALAASGLERVRARHTCAHRVDELLTVLDALGRARGAPVPRVKRPRRARARGGARPGRPRADEPHPGDMTDRVIGRI
ncbi:MAG TPA: glycosyltransferase [Anaeromyxobacter sp.]|nr:glycosyltransferase [Anaeromyxobacter sp.]